MLDCKACGQRTQVDLRQKLSGFILKNEPKGGKKGKKEKMSRRDRAKLEAQENGSVNGTDRSPHDSNSDKGDLEDDGELAAGSDDEFTKQIQEEAKNLDNATNGEEKEVEWAIDTSAEAIAARAKELPSDLKRSLAFDDDEDGEEGGHSAYDSLGTWIDEQAKELGSVGKVDDVDIYKKAADLGIEHKHKTLTVLAQTIFDDNVTAQIPKRAGLLRKLIGESDKHQKAFLGGIERFVGNDHKELISKVPQILMTLYQNDIITEEVAKPWGTKASKKYVDITTSRKVRQAAEPFLKWLEEADSEDDEEDSDDE